MVGFGVSCKNPGLDLDRKISVRSSVVSSFLISTHTFLCVKLISNYPCSSISTELDYSITVGKWLKVPCSYYSKVFS